MPDFVTESELTCPACGFSEVLTLPVDACLWFHECRACQTLLKPNPGDCCVFCSFGTVSCPPIQLQTAGKAEANCCGTA